MSVLSTLLLSHLLSADEFGSYTIINTNALLIQLLAGGWLTSIANRVLATDDKIDYGDLSAISSGLILITILMSLVFAIHVGLANGSSGNVFAVLIIAMLFIIYDTTLSIFNAIGDELSYSKLSLWRSVLTFFGSISLATIGFGFSGAVCGLIAGTILPLVTIPSVVSLWKNARPSRPTLRALRSHLKLGIAGASLLGIYILVNAPSRNIMEDTFGASAVGSWVLSADLFYGPLAVIGNAFALSQLRLLYLAASTDDTTALTTHARELVEFTLALAIPYAIGGLFFASHIVVILFPDRQIASAVLMVGPAVIQGSALLVLYNLVAVALARRQFRIIISMVSTTAGAAALAAWTAVSAVMVAWSSALACTSVVALWLASGSLRGERYFRFREVAKLSVVSLLLIAVAAVSSNALSFPGGWILALTMAVATYVGASLGLRLAGFCHALPPTLRRNVMRDTFAG